jgi:hypothetical protein
MEIFLGSPEHVSSSCPQWQRAERDFIPYLSASVDKRVELTTLPASPRLAVRTQPDSRFGCLWRAHPIRHTLRSRSGTGPTPVSSSRRRGWDWRTAREWQRDETRPVLSEGA